jgi:hypothetical protein
MMGRNRTSLMKSTSVSARPELTATLVRLMLSVNDIALAADASDQWAETGDRKRAAMRNAARGYFVRVLLSHVYEGLLIVEEISQLTHLRSAVDECDKHTISAFRFLEDVVESKEMDLFRVLRSRATFHYDQQLPLLSLAEIAKQQPDRQWSCSVGSEPLDWRFELADAVVDRMMIREVFRLRGPRGPERTAKTEELALRLQDISHRFTEFAFHFVRHFSR